VHYFQQPTAIITANGQSITEKTGVVNTLIPELAVNQAIFSPSLLYSATTAKLYVQQARQITDSTKIGVVASVSKAFYNLLLTLQQIGVLKEDTLLFSRNVTDAYHQYIGGIVDATDYEEATITLNNAKAQLRQATENVIPQYALLKQLMGFKPEDQFNVGYDTAQMMKDIALDTTQQLKYEQRIEYQQLMTAKELQRKAVLYNELSFLPTLGAYYDYNYELESNSFSNLFSAAYPNSLIGVSLNLPLFTGLSRIESVHRAKLQAQLLDWSEVSLKADIYTQYATAIANYNSNLFNMNQLQQNVALSKKVYGVVVLQYRQGIVPYLNVITAESNLIASEINYLNALFTVLSSKIDVEQAMGVIVYK
jgi:outer membrane protein TolC